MNNLRTSSLSWAALATALAALGACSDSLHLAPPTSDTTGTGGNVGGGGQGGDGGGGGNAPVSCVSNSDCPAPMAICDEAKEVCVECLVFADCGGKPGTVCSKGQCACPTAGEAYCDGSLGQASRCVDLATASEDCGACGVACFGACVGGACADAWRPTGQFGAPEPRSRHSAVWTGEEMIIWGGHTPGITATGGVYDPKTNAWRATSLANAPSARGEHTAVWTGSRMIVWGGSGSGGFLGAGGVYDPATNTWKSMSSDGAPSPRTGHVAVWAGAPVSKMLVWGGSDSSAYLGSGAAYDPMTDAWTPMTPSGAPSARRDHAAVWTGSKMILFGGYGYDSLLDTDGHLTGGGVYAPSGDAWNGFQTNGPSARSHHTAAWTGTEMLVWGGLGVSGVLGNGQKYKDQESSWTTMNAPSPTARQLHTAVWIPAPVSRMFMWGGDDTTIRLGSGRLFDPETNSWATKDVPTAPGPRNRHTAVVAGTDVIVWGGEDISGVRTNTGAIFDPTLAN